MEQGDDYSPRNHGPEKPGPAPIELWRHSECEDSEESEDEESSDLFHSPREQEERNEDDQESPRLISQASLARVPSLRRYRMAS